MKRSRPRRKSERAARASSNEKKPHSIRAAARELGVHRETLEDWLGAGCPPKRADGSYDVKAIKRWREENRRESTTNGTQESTSGQRLKAAQAREREAKAKLAELELAARRSELIPRSEVKEWDLRRIGVLKRGLMGLAERLPPLCEGLSAQEIKVAIRHSVDELLHRFANL